MEPLRVRNRGGALWFILAALFMGMGAVTATFAEGKAVWAALGIFGGLGLSALAWGLYGAKRFIEFGDEIVVHYFLRQRVIPWDDVSFVSCERSEMKVRTGIPFVSIPTENHDVTLRLKNGDALSADIHPSQVPAISRIVASRATLDIEREAQRVATEAASEQRFDLLFRSVMGLVFFGMGIWFTVSMWHEIVQGTRSSQWPLATGRVVSSRVDAEHSKGRRGREYTYYSPVVDYTYTVDGREYTGNRFRFSPEKSQNSADVSAIVNLLGSGSEINVRYDPSKPTESVLVPGLDADRYVFFGALIVGGFAGVIYSIVNMKRYARSRRAGVPA